MCSLAKCLYCIFLLALCVAYGICHKSPNNFPARVLRTTETGCILPEKPKFGNWSVYDPENEEWFPGKKLPSGKYIIISCNEGYMLKGSFVRNCINNMWSNSMPECLIKCPPLYDSPHLRVACYEKSKIVNCSEAVEGFYAEFQCDRFYEIESVKNQPNYCSKDGTWKNKIPKCVLTCGKNIYDDPATINGGSAADIYAYPWQAAIYNKKDKTFMCGAALIDERIILTAAHCITKESTYTKDSFEIAVGKYYSRYHHPQDDTPQFSSVQEIFLPDNYAGWMGKYKNDIAVIVTTNNFTISERVRPICIDWEGKYLKRSIRTFRDGIITGWGFITESGNISMVLNELRIPAIDRNSCMDRLPHSFRQHLTEDKFCAGYLNQSKSACKGDSGGGLIFKEDSRYFISGIVSVAPTSSDITNAYSCDNGQYSLYTSVSYHKIFLTEKLAEAHALDTEDEIIESESACTLPDPPQHGYYKVNNNSAINKPPSGQIVRPGTRLTIMCQDQHTLTTPNNLLCENGTWNHPIGKCIKTCPSIFSTKTMNVHCMYKSIYLSLRYAQNCVHATDGTLAEFECAPFYEDLALSRHPVHICMNGKWDQTTPTCSPACGKLDANMKHNFFPWHVAIYNKTNKNLICSGSLVNERVIVTAAHCVTNDALNLKPLNDLLVTAGSGYRTFKDVRDDEYVQSSKVKHIFLPDSELFELFDQDIAIIVIERSFRLTQRVLPVCLEKRQLIDYTDETSNIATSGWGYNIDKNENGELLKVVKISFDSLKMCRDEQFMNYNLSSSIDKICMKPNDTGLMTCYGDTGAGLVYQHEGRYYLGGVRSLSLNTPTSPGACDRQKFDVYTNTYLYSLNFIVRKEVEFRP